MENENIVSGGDVLDGSSGSVSVYADNVYVISDDGASAVDVGEGGSGYQLPEYWVDYFQGLLANMFDTEYVAFAERVYDSGSNYSYVDNYYLVYDLDVADDVVQQGTYPCYHVYRNSSNSGYYTLSSTTYSLTSYPSLSYGSVGGTSDLRKGVTHYEIYAVLLFLAVFTVMYLCGSIFKCVRGFKH